MFHPSLLESILGLLLFEAIILALAIPLACRSKYKKPTVEVKYDNPIDRLRLAARSKPVAIASQASAIALPNVPSNLQIRGPAASGARKYPRGSPPGSVFLRARESSRLLPPKQQE